MASTNGNHDIQSTEASAPTSPTSSSSSTFTSAHSQRQPQPPTPPAPLPANSPSPASTPVNPPHLPPSDSPRSNDDRDDEDISREVPPQSPPILAAGSSPFAPPASNCQLLLTSPLTRNPPDPTPLSPTYNKNKRPSESEPSVVGASITGISDDRSNSADAPPSATATAPNDKNPEKSASQPAKRQRRNTKKDENQSIESGKEGRKGSTGSMASERPRLSEQEKKNNHIASEQKRRMAIREGFDRLTEIVPGLEGQGRSESIVLKKSVDHMRDVLNERQELIQRIQALGGEIPPELRQN